MEGRVNRLPTCTRGRQARYLEIALGLVLLCGLVACGESKAEHCACRPCAEPTDAGTPVDPPLLSFLSRARAAHHMADGLEQSRPANLDRAIAVLTDVADGPLPRGAATSPEVREVLADTLARVADLQTREGRLDEARDSVERGLRQVPETNYYRGHLYELLGIIEEREHQTLAQQKDAEGAAAAAARALLALDEAMRIQAEVIAQAGPDAAPSVAPPPLPPPAGSTPQKAP